MPATAPAAFNPKVAPVIPGNLPTTIRYRVKNNDGSVSTVLTMSIGTDDGEVLIPTVVNGRVVSEREAIDHWRKTGENFGVFKSVADADAYAEALHNYHASILEQEKNARKPMSFAPQGVPGETITSTYRTKAHNAAVHGVPNSYHTRKGPDGRALARDSVPPAGMSMSAYHALLKRLNPNLDVLNEGDHVHMEPRG